MPDSNARKGILSRCRRLCLVCLVFAALTQGAAAEQPDVLREMSEKPLPPAVSFLLWTVLGGVGLSWAWLLRQRASGKTIFTRAEPARAEWSVADLALAALSFVVLPSLLFPFVGDSIVGRLTVNNVAKVAVACIIIALIRHRGQNPREALGLRLRGLGGPLARAVGLFLAFMPVVVAVGFVWRSILFQWLGPDYSRLQTAVVLLAESGSAAVIVQMVIAVLLVAPLTEELFFRGLMYGLLRRHVRPAFAIVAVGAIFGAFHDPLAVAIPLSVFGGLLCYVYEKTGRLTVPIVVHGLFNLCSVMLIILYRSS